MRVAFVVGAFPELSTTFILDQVTGLLELGHDVQVFARAPPRGMPVHEDFERFGLGARTLYWGSSGAAARAVIARTSKLLQRDARRHGHTLLRTLDARSLGWQALTMRFWSYAATMLAHGPFDVVLAQFGPNGRIALKLRDLGAFEAPIATTWLGYDLSRVLREQPSDYYSDMLARTELMLPLSQHFRERLLGLGCSEGKIAIHPIGVDVSRLCDAPRRADGERVRLLSVCRLVEKKGLEFALRALREVAARGVEFSYDIVGDGPQRASLETIVDALGLRSRVTLHGAKTRAELQTYTERAQLFVATSVRASNGDEEGIPTVLKEAMAIGLPVISTYHAAIPELIEHGVSGVLVPEWDVACLAGEIATLIASPERWAALAYAARKAVECECDLTVLNRRLADELAVLARDYAARDSLRATCPDR